MIRVVFILFLSTAAWAANYTARVSGNWASQVTWGNSGPPGDGDTATINDGVTVTLYDTRIIGQSLAAGNVAIQFHATGALVISGTGYLKVRGDMQYAGSPDFGATMYTSPYLAIQAGGILEFDSSAATATSVQYTAHPDNRYGARGLVTTGTTDAHAIIRSNAGGGNGYFSLGGFDSNPGGSFSLTYTDVQRIGDAVNPAFKVLTMSQFDNGTLTHGGNYLFPWVSVHNTFDSCGMAPAGGGQLGGEGIFQNSYNIYINSKGVGVTDNTPVVMSIPGAGTQICNSAGVPAGCVGPGVREINANVFDIFAVSEADFTDFTILSNYFGGGFRDSESIIKTSPLDFRWRYFQNNIFRTPRSTDSMFNPLMVGDVRDTLWILDEAISTNPHGPGFTGVPRTASGITVTGNISDHMGKLDAQASSWFEVLADRTATPIQYMSLLNSIFLPNILNRSSFWITAVINDIGYVPSTQFTVLSHNTVIADGSNSNVAVYTAHPSTATNSVGMLTLTNNILWAPNGSIPTYKVLAGQNINNNVCVPAGCDYNDGFNMRTDGGGFSNGGRGYAENFSTTPGAHDLSIDPMFVDPTRNTATFDSAYLGNTAPAWDSGASYNFGDIVSSTDSTVYNGAVVNYRYVNAPGCDTTNPKPGLWGGTVMATNGSPVITWVSGPKFNVGWPSSSDTTMPTGPDSSNQTSCAGVVPCAISAVSNCTGQYCTTATLTSNFIGATGVQQYYSRAVPLQSRACWEWASLHRIRQAVGAQTLYDDPTIGAHSVDVITTLMQWIRAGFSPTNSALALAGNDGTDIGAVPVTFGVPLFPGATTGGLELRGPTIHGRGVGR